MPKRNETKLKPNPTKSNQTKPGKPSQKDKQDIPDTAGEVRTNT